MFNLKKKTDIRKLIQQHMGKDPSNFAVITEKFEKYNHPNLHLALEEYKSQPGRTAEVCGIQGGGFLNTGGTPLSDLVAPGSIASFMGLSGCKVGPVQYTNMQLDGKKTLSCIQGGLFLIGGDVRLTVLMRQQHMDFAGDAGIYIDVLAEPNTAGEFMNALKQGVNKHNVYRGKIISLDRKDSVIGSAANSGLKFHTLPSITREKIILPEGLLERIERQTIDVGKYSQSLLKAGRKLKRGILLHGKPGTGKTLTAMYLASAMKERTVLVLTGRGQGLIESSCQLARWLEPSMVIIEDVDLIAEERSGTGQCNTAVLLELLNQMDGLADDADVLFMLTTNRPEILEPALASRPGRVDQAYEVPLPDADCRRRLFELYSQGLTMQVENMEQFVKRTNGASGAFISELLRKAALFAAPDGDPIVVTDKHLDEAMHELVVAGGTLTKSLLGFREFGFVPGELTGAAKGASDAKSV
jgi:hypothetical protein